MDLLTARNNCSSNIKQRAKTHASRAMITKSNKTMESSTYVKTQTNQPKNIPATTAKQFWAKVFHLKLFSLCRNFLAMH